MCENFVKQFDCYIRWQNISLMDCVVTSIVAVRLSIGPTQLPWFCTDLIRIVALPEIFLSSSSIVLKYRKWILRAIAIIKTRRRHLNNKNSNFLFMSRTRKIVWSILHGIQWYSFSVSNRDTWQVRRRLITISRIVLLRTFDFFWGKKMSKNVPKFPEDHFDWTEWICLGFLDRLMIILDVWHW